MELWDNNICEPCIEAVWEREPQLLWTPSTELREAPCGRVAADPMEDMLLVEEKVEGTAVLVAVGVVEAAGGVQGVEGVEGVCW